MKKIQNDPRREPLTISIRLRRHLLRVYTSVYYYFALYRERFIAVLFVFCRVGINILAHVGQWRGPTKNITVEVKPQWKPPRTKKGTSPKNSFCSVRLYFFFFPRDMNYYTLKCIFYPLRVFHRHRRDHKLYRQCLCLRVFFLNYRRRRTGKGWKIRHLGRMYERGGH